MSGDMESGKCSCCGNLAIVNRKYYHYDIKCDCCNGDEHFEIIYYCENCEPRPPSRVHIVLEMQPRD